MSSVVTVVLFSLCILQPAQLWAQAAAAAPPSTPDTVPTLSSLFTDLPGDFAHLITTGNAAIVGTAGLGAWLIRGDDARITRRLITSQALDHVFEPGELLGGGALQIGGAFATYMTGWLAGNGAMATVGADLFRAQIISGGLAQAVKVTVRRTRPDGANYSFPSGHASSAFATATVLQRRFGWRVGVPSYALATHIALSRLQENRHYLSDVAFGAAIGIVSGRSITMRTHRVAHGTFRIEPAVFSHGPGVSVAWTPGQ